MKNFFNKLLVLLKENRRLFSIGLIIGLISFGLWTAILSATCTAGAAESKDKINGDHWDWIEFSMIIIGSLVGYLINFLIFL